MSTPDEAGTFTIELPQSVLTPFAGTPETFAREVRLAAAMEWYREGRVFQGNGSRDRRAEPGRFPRALYRQGAACQVTVDEVMEEVERAVASHRERFAPDPANQGGTP